MRCLQCLVQLGRRPSVQAVLRRRTPPTQARLDRRCGRPTRGVLRHAGRRADSSATPRAPPCTVVNRQILEVLASVLTVQWTAMNQTPEACK